MRPSVSGVAFLGIFSFLCARAGAQEVVLKSADHSVEVRMVSIAGGSATYPNFLVSWDHLSSEPSSGTLVFYRDGNSPNYVSVGKSAPFVLVKSEEQTLVAGTLVPVYQLAPTNSQQIIELRADTTQHPSVEPLRASYEQGQGLAHANATKADAQTTLDAAGAAFQQACGAKPKFDVKWTEFSGDRAWLVSALGAVTRGLADKCANTKYKGAIAKLDSFSIHFDPSVKAEELRLRRAGSKVELTVGPQVLNPRQRATAWITSDL